MTSFSGTVVCILSVISCSQMSWNSPYCKLLKEGTSLVSLFQKVTHTVRFFNNNIFRQYQTVLLDYLQTNTGTPYLNTDTYIPKPTALKSWQNSDPYFFPKYMWRKTGWQHASAFEARIWVDEGRGNLMKEGGIWNIVLTEKENLPHLYILASERTHVHQKPGKFYHSYFYPGRCFPSWKRGTATLPSCWARDVQLCCKSTEQ